jgi:DNA-binding CsgD family transcriptional regulator
MTTLKPGAVLVNDRILLRNTISRLDDAGHCIRQVLALNDRELEFMRLVCTECTYKEIADQMYLSPRTIDGYRDALFEKLNVRTRVGLAMYAVRSGIVSIDYLANAAAEYRRNAGRESKGETLGIGKGRSQRKLIRRP